MNQEYDKHALIRFRQLTGYSIETKRILEILDRFGDHLDTGNNLAHVLIRHLDHVPNLEYLSLWGNQFGPEGAVALAQGLQYVPKLKYLGIRRNRIGDEGAAALAQGLQHVPNLTDLDLWNNRIGPEGAAALAKGLHHVPNLTRLHLRWNQIGPKGILNLSYVVPNEVHTDFIVNKRIHPYALSYLLLIHSDFPIYDLLDAWKERFGSLGNEKAMRNLLTW